MSADTRSSSSPHTAAWVVAVALVVLPLLYLLSVAPIARFTLQGGRLPAEWMLCYMTPYAYVRDHTPLGRPLQAYMDWWTHDVLVVWTRDALARP